MRWRERGTIRIGLWLGGLLALGAGISGGLVWSGVVPEAHATATGAPTGAASRSTVTVSGTGQAVGRPDQFELSIGVSDTSDSATGALDRNTAELAALEHVLVGSGVRKTDLQTSGLSLNPNYGSSGAITGYAATEELSVTMTHLETAGDVIDAAAHAVGNDVEIDGISFSISNQSALLATARTRAMRDAERRAGELAAATGARLGRVQSVSESEQTEPLPLFYGHIGAMSAAAAAPRVPLEAGSQPVEVTVRATFALEG